MQNEREQRTALKAKAEDAVLIIGIDPVEIHQRWLALLVSTGGTAAHYSVVKVDLDKDQRLPPLQLPSL